MIVTSTEIQNNFGKYLALVDGEDIIISKNGKKVARLVKYFKNDDYIIREGGSTYSHEGMKVNYYEFLKIARESENRYEYIDGEIYLLAGPKVSHQKVLMNISLYIFNYFKDKECISLMSPLDITLYRKDSPNVVQPDLLVICDLENISDDDTYQGTPTIVLEILSESTQSKDMTKKLDLYMYSGVKEYWIVNPISKEIMIYYFEKKEVQKLLTYKKDEIATSVVFSNMEVDLSQVFV